MASKSSRVTIRREVHIFLFAAEKLLNSCGRTTTPTDRHDQPQAVAYSRGRVTIFVAEMVQ
jgi:hypothetical protein